MVVYDLNDFMILKIKSVDYRCYLSDCNWARTHNHLVHKRTLNHLAKLAKLVLVCTVHLTLDAMYLI